MSNQASYDGEVILREFPYRIPGWLIFFNLIFIPITWLLVDEAIHNQRGLIINNALELSPSQATLFYWALAAFGLCAIGFGIWILYSNFVLKPSVILTSESIVLPKLLFSPKITKVPFSRIKKMELWKLNGQRILYIYANSKRYNLPEAGLQKGVFDEVMLWLSESVQRH